MSNVESKTDSVSVTRNSEIRRKLAGTIDSITQKLHEAFPDAIANDITLLGVIGTGVGAGIASMRDGDHSQKDDVLTGLSTVINIASQGTDAFDGSMARLISKETHQPMNPNGQLYDVASDRLGELLLSLGRVISAEKRHDSLGSFAALATAVTSPLPSTARAYAESKGTAVPETGKGVLGLVGTRVGRAFLGILATEFPEIKGVPVQVIADTLITTANIITTTQRLKAHHADAAPLPMEIQTDAKKRLKLLGTISVVSAVAAGVTYTLTRKK
jgi:phosphatidylglycerophosphate synthase